MPIRGYNPGKLWKFSTQSPASSAIWTDKNHRHLAFEVLLLLLVLNERDMQIVNITVTLLHIKTSQNPTQVEHVQHHTTVTTSYCLLF
jgi:hypothetical protein